QAPFRGGTVASPSGPRLMPAPGGAARRRRAGAAAGGERRRRAARHRHPLRLPDPPRHLRPRLDRRRDHRQRAQRDGASPGPEGRPAARETADDMGVAMKMTPVRDSLIAECTPTSERADVMKGEKPEDVAACDAQLAAAWAKYMTPTPEGDRHDVLVCHGNVIRWFVSHALGADPRWLRMEIGNGSMTILSVRPDGTP